MWRDESLESARGLAFRRAGSGPAVVLVHGIPGAGAAWEGVVRELPASLDVVVVDLLGFGASRRPHGLAHLHAQAQAEALAALLDELELRRVTIVGHDFGGPVAILTAGRSDSRVAGLGLLSANAFADTPIPFPLSLVTMPLVGGLAGRMLFSVPSQRLMLRQGVGPGASAPPAELYLGDGEQRQAIATIFEGSLTGLRELYAPIEHTLRGLRLPGMVAWGDRDPFFGLDQGRRTAEALGADLRVYAAAGHFLPHERPSEVAADICALVEVVGTA